MPLGFLGKEYKGVGALASLPSFGFGSLVGSGTLTGIWYAVVRSQQHQGQPPPSVGNCKTLFAGMASGLVWNLGNLCQIIAMSVYNVPYGVAYPILQAALVVAGLLGIFVFREMRDRSAMGIFFLSSAVRCFLFGEQ